MSDAPTPPPDAAAEDWKKTVLQSYRNTEVREISKVLANLEPGASANSKLMLAMRFEDSTFKAASSLIDYKKKITKRLKKLQKNYVPPADPSATAAAVDGEALEAERQELLLKLQQKWGDALRYIYIHADTAITEIRQRLGAERATQLEQHTKSANQWAVELGVLKSIPSSVLKQPVLPTTRILSKDYLQRVEQHLDRRVDNIRSYVVKHAQPDVFLLETLMKKDAELAPRSVQLLGVNLRKRMEQIQKSKLNETQLLQTSLEKAAVPVPPPTRNNVNEKPACLLHLDKMRAASTVVLAYLSHAERSTTPKETLSKAHAVATDGIDFIQNYFTKLKDQQAKKTRTTVGTDSSSTKRKLSPESQCTLQDAWNKTIELPVDVVDEVALVDDGMAALDDTGTHTQTSSVPSNVAGGDDSATKKRKLNTSEGVGSTTTVSSAAGNPLLASSSGPIVIQARVLLTPNRRVPPNLILALKRKRATLIRPPPSGLGSHLILRFGTAFTMTIYLSPLLVTLRAMSKAEREEASHDIEDMGDGKAKEKQIVINPTSSLTNSGICRFKLLSHGLMEQDNDGELQQQRQRQPLKQQNTPGSSSVSSSVKASQLSSSSLSVWGVTGTYSGIGHVVEERLRDASTYCTQTLRQCFTNTVKKSGASDFDIETLEATALLEFLQLARRTYIPDWKDLEVIA